MALSLQALQPVPVLQKKPVRASWVREGSSTRPAGLAQAASTPPFPFIPGGLPENGDGGVVDKGGGASKPVLAAAGLPPGVLEATS